MYYCYYYSHVTPMMCELSTYMAQQCSISMVESVPLEVVPTTDGTPSLTAPGTSTTRRDVVDDDPHHHNRMMITILDGGTGHELEQRGISNSDGSFFAGVLANETNQAMFEDVHCDFLNNGVCTKRTLRCNLVL